MAYTEYWTHIGLMSDPHEIKHLLEQKGFIYNFVAPGYQDTLEVESKLDYPEGGAAIHVFDTWTLTTDTVKVGEGGGWGAGFSPPQGWRLNITVFFKNPLDLTMARLIL